MWKLGRIAGIDVSLHWTLLLLIGWTGLNAPAGGALAQIALTSAIFGCVLLHELGHSLAARQFGIDTSSIVLLPIGGVATLQRMPRSPFQELWIAIAGPMVNAVIAATLLLSMGILHVLVGDVTWFRYLMYANIVLVVFNLLPAFPMDGGRVLRACLAMRKPYVEATANAAKVGKLVAIGLGVLGLLAGQFMLILVAAFVIFAGSAEARMVADEDRHLPANSKWGEQLAQSFSDARAFTAERAGESMKVVWDENERRYRYAHST